jgi:hypothetical protein
MWRDLVNLWKKVFTIFEKYRPIECQSSLFECPESSLIHYVVLKATNEKVLVLSPDTENNSLNFGDPKLVVAGLSSVCICEGGSTGFINLTIKISNRLSKNIVEFRK